MPITGQQSRPEPNNQQQEGKTHMTRKTIPLIDSQRAAARILLKLGAKVSWPAWLADIRRTPREGYPVPDLYGLQLRPYARHGNVVLYRPSDVDDFIAAVLAADPGIKAASKPTFYVVDDSGELQPWRWRKARPIITPTMPAALFKRAA